MNTQYLITSTLLQQLLSPMFWAYIATIGFALVKIRQIDTKAAQYTVGGCILLLVSLFLSGLPSLIALHGQSQAWEIEKLTKAMVKSGIFVSLIAASGFLLVVRAIVVNRTQNLKTRED